MRPANARNGRVPDAMTAPADRRQWLAQRLDVGDESASAAAAWPIAPVLLAFACGWLAFAWPWLSGAVAIPWDAKAHFAPQIQFMAQAIARGESPFWLPYAFSGTPQIADPQSMLFSPPFLVLALVDGNPTGHAIDVTVMLALLLVGWSVVWLARDLGWHWAGALVAALGFCFGASMAWRLQHFGQVLSLGYLPLAMLAVGRMVGRGSVGWGLVAGLLGACIVLGRDQVGLLAVYILAGYTLSRLVADGRPWSTAWRAMPALAGATLTGLLLVALPLLMTWLYAAQSNRPGIDLAGAERGSLHPGLAITAVVPHLFGAAGAMADYWGPPSFTWTGTDLFLAQNMGLLYVSMPLVLLLTAGAARRVLLEAQVRFFTLVLVLSLLYALGRYTPVFRLFYEVLPGVGFYRRPADATFLVGGFAALCAGYVAHRWLSGTLPHAGPLARLVEIAVPVGAMALAVGMAVHFDRLELARRPLAFATVWIGLAVLALAAIDHLRPIRPIAAGALLAIIVTADLVANNGPNGATALPPRELDMLSPATLSPTLRLLKAKVAEATGETDRPRVELTALGFHSPNASLTHRLENVVGYNPVRPRPYVAAVGAGDSSGNADQRSFPPLFPSYRSTLADLLGLRFIATGVPIGEVDKSLAGVDPAARGITLVARTADGYVYENASVLPRVLYATAAHEARFDDLVASGAWPALDYRRSVLLEHVPAGSAGVRRPGRVRILSYHPTEVVLEADGEDGGWVVLADMWHPWWRARVDAVPTTIERANVLFRAVAVPPGRHRIEFRFEPVRGAIEEALARMQAPRARDR